MRFSTIFAAVLLALSATAGAQETEKSEAAAAPSEEPWLSRGQTTDLANGLAGAQRYTKSARALRLSRDVQQLSKSSITHTTAPCWRPGIFYHSSTTSGIQKTLARSAITTTTWKGVIEAAATSFLSILERGDEEALDRETAICGALHEAQVIVVQMIRDQAAGR